MPKSSTDPTYLPGFEYPARDAEGDVSALIEFIEPLIHTYAEAVRAARGEIAYVETPAERLRVVSRLVGDAQARAGHLVRLLAELSTEAGVTQRTTGSRLRVAHTSVAQWRRQPLSRSDLTLPPRPNDD